MNKQEKHIFAFFSEHETKALERSLTDKIVIAKVELVTRISKILRMAPGEVFGLFNNTHNALLEITAIDKKKVECRRLKFEQNLSNPMEITLAVGAVRQGVFEEIVQNCSAIGVDKIVQVKTEKSQAQGTFNKDRVDQISIGAREQSKNYNPVEIGHFISLEDLVESSKEGLKLLALPDGQSLEQLTQKTPHTKATILVGPPEGWSEKEIIFLKNNGFQPFTLGKNILKTELAATLSAGMARALCTKTLAH